MCLNQNPPRRSMGRVCYASFDRDMPLLLWGKDLLRQVDCKLVMSI